MRYLLGHENKIDVLFPLEYVNRSTKINTEVFAYFCGSCGTESVGVVINADEPLSYSEAKRQYGEYASERLSEIKKGRQVSREMLDTVLNCKNCPMCGQPFQLKKGFYNYKDNYGNSVRFFIYKANEIFANMEIERKEAFRIEAQDTVKKITENANDNNHKADALVPRTAEIAASTQTLLSYIGYLMRLEVGLYAVQQNLVELYRGKSELRESLLMDYQKKLEELQDEINSSKGEKENLEKEHDSFISGSEPQIDYPTEPQKPRKPLFNDVLPQEPVYQTAGLFNKKKVAAENEAKKKAYEAALLSYKQRQSAYQTELENYNKELVQYEAAYAEWSTEVETIKKKAQSDYQVAVAQKEVEYNKKLSELNDKIKNLEEKKKQIIDSLAVGGAIDSQAGMTLFAEEISEGEKLLESIVAARNELYSYNVIYPKYRNLVALSSFYDYLMSGRCNALAGNDGAYNLYESESRADLIITKLSDVLTSLDRIQDNQYMLYQQMSDVNKGVKALNESMTSVVSSLAHIEASGDEMKNYMRSINSETANISTNVKSIRDNAEITAHYSKVSAFYAKKNAELTDALGYMTAFK